MESWPILLVPAEYLACKVCDVSQFVRLTQNLVALHLTCVLSRGGRCLAQAGACLPFKALMLGASVMIDASYRDATRVFPLIEFT
jgi:hypothetical protein